MNISAESGDLIRECERDIAEFGPDEPVVVWVRSIAGRRIVTNYDFNDPESPIKSSEIAEGETLALSTLGGVLVMLKKQNKVL